MDKLITITSKLSAQVYMSVTEVFRWVMCNLTIISGQLGVLVIYSFS